MQIQSFRKKKLFFEFESFCFVAAFLSSPPKADTVARPMETSGPKSGKRESGSGSSPDGTDSEDFVMVPAHLTMDAAEVRKHHNRGVVT